MNVTLPVLRVAAGHLPDADADVIVFLEDGRSEMGGIDETGWVDAGGMTFAHRGERVIAWAEFPVMTVGVPA